MNEEEPVIRFSMKSFGMVVFDRISHGISIWYSTIVPMGGGFFPSDSEVKNPPVIQEPQETQIPALGLEDPLEEEMATHSSILAWRILWTEEPGRLQSMGSQRVGHNWSDSACVHAPIGRLINSWAELTHVQSGSQPLRIRPRRYPWYLRVLGSIFCIFLGISQASYK